LDLGQVLAVALTLPVPGLVLVLHDRDLRTLGGLDDLGLDGDLGELVGVAGHGRAVDHEEGGEVNAIAGLATDLVDDEDVADRDLLLAATSANNRVHGELSFVLPGARALCLDRPIVTPPQRAAKTRRQ